MSPSPCIRRTIAADAFLRLAWSGAQTPNEPRKLDQRLIDIVLTLYKNPVAKSGFELLADAIIDDVFGRHVVQLGCATDRGGEISRDLYAEPDRLRGGHQGYLPPARLNLPEMESIAVIGNSGPELLNDRNRLRHLQCVGCDRKNLWLSVGLQLELIGTRWSSLASLGKKIHRQHLTEEVRGAESILQAKAANF